MSEEKKQPGFSIKDRRAFTAEGEPRGEETQEKRQPVSEPAPDKSSQPRAPQRPESRQEPPSSIDFSSFILSLTTTAMVHLGEVPDPATGAARQNMDAARQMVDILTMLEQKTKGNLNPEEAQLIEEVLYELRMKFLAKTNTLRL